MGVAGGIGFGCQHAFTVRLQQLAGGLVAAQIGQKVVQAFQLIHAGGGIGLLLQQLGGSGHALFAADGDIARAVVVIDQFFRLIEKRIQRIALKCSSLVHGVQISIRGSVAPNSLPS